MSHSYELPIFSFLSIFLVLLPSPWHWKARNVATLSLIAWIVVCSIVRGVNSIIWMDNVVIRYRVWCDISAKILIGMSVALPACSFCLTRHLEHVASSRSAITTKADKKRRRIIDLCITFGTPVIIMVLHYTVQGHRFDIIEDIGCQPVTYTSILGLLIINAVPIVLSIGSLIYAAIALTHFAKRRLEFEQHLRNSQSSLNTARYMRLMALALSEMFWGTSLGIYVLVANIHFNGVRPMVGWKQVHYNFSRVAIWPERLVPPADWTRLMLSWWILPCTAILFFIFFGLSEEARDGYGAMFSWLWRQMRRAMGRPVESTTFSKGTSLPQFTCETVCVHFIPETHRFVGSTGRRTTPARPPRSRTTSRSPIQASSAT
ncbi:STE3-domain-containing protein [Auricularia subglabra TFB-10046 SS5]|nr:STE3-domain-containing protein [Auricularia subglabra TFB-10046 SS5]